MTVDFELLRVKDFEYWSLFLHEDQTFLGRCYLALNREGDLDPFVDCSFAERAEVQHIIAQYLVPSLRDLFQPTKFNYANLRNDWPHCHWHIVPRYQTSRSIEGWDFVDPAWGKNWSKGESAGPFPQEILFKIRDMLKASLV